MKKGKKNKDKKQGQKQETETKNDNAKSQQMNNVMNALQTMDLDNPDFIDINAFDQSKAILQNSLDDLKNYLKLFEKGQYNKFPKLQTT